MRDQQTRRFPIEWCLNPHCRHVKVRGDTREWLLMFSSVVFLDNLSQHVSHRMRFDFAKQQGRVTSKTCSYRSKPEIQ